MKKLAKTLRWQDIQVLLRGLEGEGYEVLSPVKNEYGDPFPEPGVPKAWPRDFLNYTYPFLREMVIPWEEDLPSVKGDEVVLPEFRRHRAVFFGARPCDASALAYTDHFFLEREFSDERYAHRRKGILVIAVACEEPCPFSFCKAMGTGPWARRGFDIQLYPGDETWIAEAGSPKGAQLLSRYPDAPGELLEETRTRLDEAFKAQPDSVPAYTKNHDRDAYLGDRCFGCGGCVWLCPTCTCYTQTPVPGQGIMARKVDACLLEGYHRLAGGGSLRPTIADRMGFRLECKLQVGACVGCGRCSATCIGHAAMDAFLEFSGKEVNP